VEFRVLGPLEVTDGSRRLDLGAAKQRSLLALLLLEHGQGVATDRLIDRLWGSSPPETARKSIQKYVSHLRDVLGGDRIQTLERGYVIKVGEGELDLDAFEQLRSSAIAAEPRVKASTLRRALSIVRGEPLADLQGEPWHEQVAERIGDLVLTAREECHDAELALGEHRRLVPELDTLVRAHPFRERSLEHLMLALYRSGRQADALAVYRRASAALRSELGLEPGTALRDLERRVLVHDPMLTVPETDPGRRPSRFSRRRLAVVGGLAVAAAALVFGLDTSTSSGTSLKSLKPSIVLLDSRTGRVIVSWPYWDYRYPWVTTGDGAFWLASFTNGFTEVDPSTGQIRRRILPPFGNGTNLALPRGKNVWSTGRGGLARYDLASNKVVATHRPFSGHPPIGLFGITFAAGSIWAASFEQNEVIRFNPATLGVVARIAVPKPWSLSSGDHQVWVSSQSDGVLRIDARTNRVVAIARLPDPSHIDEVVAGSGYAFATNGRRGTVAKIDVRGHVVATYHTGAGAQAPSYSAGAVWVSNASTGTLVRIDARTGARRTFRFGHTLGTEAALGRYVMLAITPGSTSGH
jgi:DNA-binding SARP family transcriptional activator/streptogramin lyase